MHRITLLIGFLFALEQICAQSPNNLRGTNAYGGELEVSCCPRRFDCNSPSSDVGSALNSERIQYCRTCGAERECTEVPSTLPSIFPTDLPSVSPTIHPTASPTTGPPTVSPTMPRPTVRPTTSQPTHHPTPLPTPYPTSTPTLSPTPKPTNSPTPKPIYLTSSGGESSGSGGGYSEVGALGETDEVYDTTLGESIGEDVEESGIGANNVRDGQAIGTEASAGSSGQGSEAKATRGDDSSSAEEGYYSEYYKGYYYLELPQALFETPLSGNTEESTIEDETADVKDNADTRASPIFGGGYGFSTIARPNFTGASNMSFGRFGAGTSDGGPGTFGSRSRNGESTNFGRYNPFGN